MRRSSVRSEEQGAEIDLTPMLDVTFIMLIFFIVTASFVKEAGIEVNRPDASTSNKKDAVSILVAVSNDNQVWIDGRRVDVRAVRSVIEKLHAENPKGTVVVQADMKSNTETVVQVVDAARAAGIYDVSLATEQKM